MKTAFIIHGSNGSKNAHWYPWLKKKLEERGFQVFLPQFPIHEDQNLKNWLATLEPMKEYLEDSIMIGHSLGVPFIINVLNQWDKKIQAVFLVSGFTGKLDVKDEPNIPDFAERVFDWDKIKRNCEHFYVIHSDNDPYVPLGKAEELAKSFGVNVILVKRGEHFQAQSGFKTFDLLLEKIDEEI